MLKRSLDIILSLCALAVFFVPCLLVALAVKLTSPGPVLFWSDRVGQNNKIYSMPKFRSMRTDSPQVATHLFADATSYITPIGRFLRKSSVDELPQLWSILKGDMSIVGPRPALFNQEDLVRLRNERGISELKPGLTGWAQITGRDELTTEEKVEMDQFYLDNRSLVFDFIIIWRTFFKVIRFSGVQH